MGQRYKVALLFGPPGVGKGTQGRLLGCIPGFRHLATGDIFRSLDTSSELGRVFFDYSSRGELVPDDVTIKVLKQRLAELTRDGLYRPSEEMLLLDGVPRNIGQARLLDGDIEVLGVIHLVCRDEEQIIKRLRGRSRKEKRGDDGKEEVIRHRLRVYENETRPVLAYFGAELVSQVDAIGSPGRVLHDTLEALVPIHESNFGNILEN